MGKHQSTVDMEPEAPRDPTLHAARLLYGLRGGDGTFQSLGVSIPEVPPLRPSCNCREYSSGKDGTAEKVSARTPEIPAVPSTGTEGCKPLPPGPKGVNTALFGALAAECVKPKLA